MWHSHLLRHYHQTINKNFIKILHCMICWLMLVLYLNFIIVECAYIKGKKKNYRKRKKSEKKE